MHSVMTSRPVIRYVTLVCGLSTYLLTISTACSQNFTGFERAVVLTEEENAAANIAALANEEEGREAAPTEGYNQVATVDGSGNV